WYEKNMLRHLTRLPNDYAGALRKIPKKILNIYVHAYQSRIFNESLQQALTGNKIPETISVPGFQIPRMPELKTFQIERKSFLKARNFKIIKIKNNTVVLKFRLDNGEYATTLLSCLIN
ncbi:MAG: tRNA pseudouridine13 synthase, partial [Thermoproteota archaeon]|nr:tRNA pseudouridine13 synthase [Thermoproteota archaeon]